MTLAQIRKPLLQFRKQIRTQLNHATVASMNGAGNQLQKAFSVWCCVFKAMWSSGCLGGSHSQMMILAYIFEALTWQSLKQLRMCMQAKPDYICLHNYGSTTHKQLKAVTVMPLDKITDTCTFTFKISWPSLLHPRLWLRNVHGSNSGGSWALCSSLQ